MLLLWRVASIISFKLRKYYIKCLYIYTGTLYHIFTNLNNILWAVVEWYRTIHIWISSGVKDLNNGTGILQGASNAENVSIWWRHHGSIMSSENQWNRDYTRVVYRMTGHCLIQMLVPQQPWQSNYFVHCQRMMQYHTYMGTNYLYGIKIYPYCQMTIISNHFETALEIVILQSPVQTP